MSRSYRKPYSTFTSCSSAKDDKRVARRCLRHAENQAIRDAVATYMSEDEWDAFILPVRYEASFNDVWSWGRDGKQSLQELHHNDFNPFHVFSRPEWAEEWLEHKIKWLAGLRRK